MRIGYWWVRVTEFEYCDAGLVVDTSTIVYGVHRELAIGALKGRCQVE